MFLKKSKKAYKGKGYETYALSETYREGGKVKHKHIANLGNLTPEQAELLTGLGLEHLIGDGFIGQLLEHSTM